MSKLFRTITAKTDAPANEPSIHPASYTRIFIRDMNVDMKVGIYDHEKAQAQPVLINLEAEVELPGDWRADSYDNVVCYETITKGIRKIAESGHINLLETFAEHIAALCLLDDKIKTVTVRVEKTKVFDFARSAGIEIRRIKSYA